MNLTTRITAPRMRAASSTRDGLATTGRRLCRRFALAAVAALGLAGVARAAQIAVTNAGFENPALADGGYNTTVTGWTIAPGGAAGTFNPTTTQIPTGVAGSNTSYSNGSTISQTLGDVLKLGTYTLSVAVGDRMDTAFPGYQVQFGVMDASNTFVQLGAESSQVPSNGFLTSTVVYTADGTTDPALLGRNLAIQLIGNGIQVNFDDVRLGFAATPHPVAVYLQTQSFLKSLPDGFGATVETPMWGFVCDPAPPADNSDCVDSPAGARINAFPGQPLTINLANTLPTPVSIVIPGQAGAGDPVKTPDGRSRDRVQSFTHETPAGTVASPGAGTFSWASLRTGTYLYQSGTHPSLQVPMGLFGALVVGPATAVACPTGQPAYDNLKSCHDAETVLLFSEIDRWQNQRVAGAAAAALPVTTACVPLADHLQNGTNGYPCTIDYNPTYFLINGEVYSKTTPPAAIAAGNPGDSVLLRFLNAGLRSHAPAVVGLDMGLIAEDGNLYPGLTRQQSETLLPAGKTLDAVVAMPAGDATYALFDRMPTAFSLDTLPSGGMTAKLQVGAGSAPPTPPGTYAVNDTYVVIEDTPYAAAVPGVLANDVGLAGATVAPVSGPSNALAFNLNSDGSFSYTPNPNFSGADGFTYRATLGGNSYPAQVTLNVSAVNDAPVAAADGPYVNSIGSTITVDAAHGVLGNDADPDGDTLTAVLEAGAPGGVTLNPDGSFTYTGGTPGSDVTFSYHASDGASSSAPVEVTLHVNPVANIALNVQDPTGANVTSYSWLVEEDAMWQPDPSVPNAESMATNFHRSYVPVVAQGCVGTGSVQNGDGSITIPLCAAPAPFDQVALDPTKHYYVSILPLDAMDVNDAGDRVGHTIGGARIPLGANSTTIPVSVNKLPLPYAQISVFVFEDNGPTNGAVDGVEPGLGGFQITLEDAGGRYGIAAGTMSQDADGNPLKNSLDCFGANPPPVGVILTCPDTPANQAAGIVGEVLIKNLSPGKYGVSATAPVAVAKDWVQTSTIEGTRIIDAWVKAGEPPFFQEFGPAGWHAFIGFVNPQRLATANPGGANSVTGKVTNMHMSRPPDQTLWDSGSYDALLHTRPWVGLTSAGGTGPTIAAVQADIDDADNTASFTIGNVPDGDYQLVLWDTYLDQVIAYRAVTLTGGQAVDVGNVPVFNWFARFENNVFLDDGCPNGSGGFDGIAQDGVRQPCEAGLPEQAVNLRWRDGTVYQSFPTDRDGFVPFDQMFPFFHWLVAEVDFLRFKPTGLTMTVDGGGDASGTGRVLNPQIQADGTSTHTETGPVLTQGIQGFLGQTSVFDWGKVPYAPGENGGIAGIVYYASTRAESDPRLAVGEPWEPGIPRVKVRLYREVSKPAVAIPVLNAGFESDVLADGAFNYSVSGWTIVSGSAGTFNPTAAHIPSQAAEGANTSWSNGSTIEQALGTVLSQGTYTLSVAVGDRTDTNFPGYRVQLGVIGSGGFVLLAEDNSSLAPSNGFLASTVTYAAAAGDPNLNAPLAIRLVNSGGVQVNFDDVRLDFVAGGVALALVRETESDSWDDNLPTGCPGYHPDDILITGGPADKCYDGLRVFNQARPAVFDGGYAFGATAEDRLAPGRYVVEMVPPVGYELVKEEDVNVTFGDGYAAEFLNLPGGAVVNIVPDPATIVAATAPEPGLAQPPCVGATRAVPPVLSLFPSAAAAAPFAGSIRPLCNRKRVTLADQSQAAADFFLHTKAPIAGHFAGMILDDLAQEFNPLSPQFGEKWAPPFVPVSVRDHSGREISRLYSDQWGRMNGLVPSTFTADRPAPSGYAPAMHMTCMNDPGPIADPNNPGQTIIDPQYNPAYSNFCYTFQYMPGATTYLDTPVLPVSAFASGYNPPDCSPEDLTPRIRQVDGTGSGPLTGRGATLTIASQGIMTVPNPAYEGPLATGAAAQKTITRNFGFGTAPGTVSLNGSALPAASIVWGNDVITWNVPSNFPFGIYQLEITSASGRTTTEAITVEVRAANYANNNARRVPAQYPTIQAAIDAATPGDLVLVAPGTYDELVIMWKPVRLQGAGAGSTFINGVKRPTDKLVAWRTKIDCLFGIGAGCAQQVNALPNQPDGAAGFATEEGAALTVVGVFDPGQGQPPANSFLRGNPVARIDGFSITGGDTGGGIFVNGNAHRLQIGNNRVFGNSGSYHGGIRFGRPFLELPNDGPYGFNTNVEVHHNAITQNGSLGGAGAGLSIATGTDRYNVSRNFVCGNFSVGDGGGIGHFGLSDNGVIANNRIVLNQTFDQATTVSGGGLFIGGEPPAAGALTQGAGSVTVDANLIQGNNAGAGHGGGIRTQFVNGQDIILTLNPNNGNARPGLWHTLTLTNNVVVNNVAGWSGGGLSMQDTARSFVVNNTIAHNDSTATVGPIVINNASAPQPAGISSALHTAALTAAIPAQNNTNDLRLYSNPTLRNNIIWRNRAFNYEVVAGAARLAPVLTQTTVGACDPAANYWDLGVLGGGYTLGPVFSVLTSTAGYPGNNVSGNPNLVDPYCNGGRRLIGAPGPVEALPALDEGGAAWIDVRFGPLQVLGNYHIGAGSSGLNNGSATNAPNHDFDNQARPLQGAYDRGADEFQP